MCFANTVRFVFIQNPRLIRTQMLYNSSIQFSCSWFSLGETYGTTLSLMSLVGHLLSVLCIGPFSAALTV